ncbi:MAG: CDC48 family AAA ATPase [Candidatus Woesearchaeota archaeon]
MDKIVKLKVTEAVQDDVNKGIVRIDNTYMQSIGIRPGDIIEVTGGRTTLAFVERAYPGDIGLDIIRMDGLIRRNAKTSLGEIVTIKKADVKEAKTVNIAPAKEGITFRANPIIFKQGLMGRALMKGDIISFGGTRRRRTNMSNTPFDDIFSMLDETMMGFGFGELKLVVVDTNPKGGVFVNEQTEVIFNPEAVELKEEQALEVTYEDIGGLEEEVKKVREMIELPLKHPELFERLGIEPPKGVLLHGPPGTGKTMLAKAVATETNAHFLLINGPEIMSKYYGQSEENLRKKFEEAEKNAPSIIFIDEIDAIATKREETHGEVEKRVVAQLLAMMDGLKTRGKVIVIAATNIPNALDPALRRPGRFDREIEIGVPGKEGRLDILKIHTRNMPLEGGFYVDIFEEKLLKQIEKINGEFLRELDDNNYKLKELKTKLKKIDEISNQNISSKIKLTEKSIKDLEDKIKRLANLKDKADNKLLINKLGSRIKKFDETKKTYDISEIKSELLVFFQNEKEKEIISELIEFKIISPELVRSIKESGRSKDLENIAAITHGFVGADLAALAKEAAMIVLRRVLPNLTLKEDQAISKEVLEKLMITLDDFREALKVVRPSALREVLIEKPNIKWADIGGLEKVKQELKEAVEWPLKTPEAFKRLGVKPPKGILIYGAPGTGKTLLAKAVATESEANFISVKGPELLSKWVGESEKAVREVFKKARQTSPTIIFFDELDSLAPRRGASSDSHVTERVVNQLLTEIDGLSEMNDVVIIAASNRPDIIDTALLRPGRFDRIILTPVPDEKTRLEIFKVHTKKMPLKNVKIEELAKKTQGYVGADIEAVCREAAILALRKDIKAKEVTMEHFEEALEKVKPSVTKEVEAAYVALQEEFTSAKGKQLVEEKPVYMG